MSVEAIEEAIAAIVSRTVGMAQHPSLQGPRTVNQHAAHCELCGEWVPAGEGWLRRGEGEKMWVVTHPRCERPPAKTMCTECFTTRPAAQVAGDGVCMDCSGL